MWIRRQLTHCQSPQSVKECAMIRKGIKYSGATDSILPLTQLTTNDYRVSLSIVAPLEGPFFKHSTSYFHQTRSRSRWLEGKVTDIFHDCPHDMDKSDEKRVSYSSKISRDLGKSLNYGMIIMLTSIKINVTDISNTDALWLFLNLKFLTYSRTVSHKHLKYAGVFIFILKNE